ncbi:hypothetical protein IC765_19620 (plasmid) [Acinetobacter seifertii]|nr:hypothetical protein IC765_06430 [Acinetobacter seifertii]QNY19011.1 hypothetical protein IC765_19620 [Acinetobacter seifertii]
MVSPIDYSVDVMNPFQQAMQGFNQGTQIAANQQALAAQRAEEARKQQQYLALQQQQKDMYEFSQNPNKTFGDFVTFTTRYPQLTDQYKKSWEIMNEGQRQQSLSTAAQVMSAIKSGSPDVAQEILEEQAKAYENSGQKESAFNMRRMKGLVKKDPSNIYTTLGLFGSTVSPDEFAPMLEKMGSNERAEQMQPYQIAETQAKTKLTNAQTQGQVIDNQYAPAEKQSSINQTQSQTALNYANIQNMAEQRQIDRDTLETETSLKLQELNPSNVKLTEGAQKLVNDTMLASVASEQSANQQNDLANRIESAGGGYGAFSKFSEWIKGQTGNQGAMSQLRNEYTRIRNSQAIKNLPPGPATDKDIEMALKGFPPETADSKTIASFLRGMAKMNQRDAAYQQMQAEWVNQVGNMGSAKRDVEILGVKVPTGTTFSGYATKNIGKALKTQSNQALQRQISTGQRSYMSAVQ